MEQPGDGVNEEARRYLSSLMNKYLRVTSTDGRIFWGQFKCIDPDRNIILAQTYEYRRPSPQKHPEPSQSTGAAAAAAADAKVSTQMTSRYLGLVVIPGPHVVKVELEEFASQVKKGPTTARGDGVSVS